MIMRFIFLAVMAVFLAAISSAEEPEAMRVAKREYEQAQPAGNEAARLKYVTALSKIADGYAAEYRVTLRRDHGDEFEAVCQELAKHPMPSDSDSGKLSALRVGKWRSPRHDYLLRKDGTWSMLPLENDVTHGKWRIEGNQYYETFEPAEETPQAPYTIILLNDRHFIFAQGHGAYFESRIAE